MPRHFPAPCLLGGKQLDSPTISTISTTKHQPGPNQLHLAQHPQLNPKKKTNSSPHHPHHPHPYPQWLSRCSPSSTNSSPAARGLAPAPPAPPAPPPQAALRPCRASPPAPGPGIVARRSPGNSGTTKKAVRPP